MIIFTPVKQQKGATLIVVLLLLLVFILLALSIAASTTSRSIVVNANVLKAQSVQAAETGSDVLLALLQEGTVADTTLPTCNNAYTNQYHGNNSTTIRSSSDDQRDINLSWYACRPEGLEDTVSCGDTVSGCFSVVITGVACLGQDNTNPTNNEACTVTRILQGYAMKK